jgi:hypothetical protein
MITDIHFITEQKGMRIKRGKSWMAQAERTIGLASSIDTIIKLKDIH